MGEREQDLDESVLAELELGSTDPHALVGHFREHKFIKSGVDLRFSAALYAIDKASTSPRIEREADESYTVLTIQSIEHLPEGGPAFAWISATDALTKERIEALMGTNGTVVVLSKGEVTYTDPLTKHPGFTVEQLEFARTRGGI